jgi:hypothetical protein
MAVVTRPEQHFIAAHTLDWNSGLIGGLPRMASLADGSYVEPSSNIAVTVVPAASTQNIQEDRCHPATCRCNVAQGMVLLVADNGPWPPIHVEFSGGGVSSVGSYAIARWDPNVGSVKYSATLSVRLLGAGPDDWIFFRDKHGFTGDIWSPANPSFAPFVGCEATDGDRIVAARFDMGHAPEVSLTVGITNLYLYV